MVFSRGVCFNQGVAGTAAPSGGLCLPPEKAGAGGSVRGGQLQQFGTVHIS